MTRTPDPLITNEVLYQLSYCGWICPKQTAKFATYLLVTTANHIKIAILCRRQPCDPVPWLGKAGAAIGISESVQAADR